MEDRDANLNELRNSIRIARYDVDPVAVADAIVRRRWSVAVRTQSEAHGSRQRHGRASVTCIARRRSEIRALAA